MRPTTLLAHAGRLLDGTPDEADLRRSMSAAYYAVFDLMIMEAAEQVAVPGNPALASAIRRSIDHRSLGRVCQGVLSSGPARPKWLAEIMPSIPSTALTSAARTVLELQVARLSADYDLDTPASLQTALTCLASARLVFAVWPTIRHESDCRAFLVAIAFADRLTRRG